MVCPGSRGTQSSHACGITCRTFRRGRAGTVAGDLRANNTTGRAARRRPGQGQGQRPGAGPRSTGAVPPWPWPWTTTTRAVVFGNYFANRDGSVPQSPLLGLGEQHGPVRPARYWALLACVFYQAPPPGPEMTQCGSMSAVEAELSRDAVSVALVEMETEAPSTRKEIAA
jgi:hypothetical protein